MEKRISGRTNLLALFGTPVGHSGSPAMYNFSFEHDGIDCAYMAFDVNVDQMPQAMESVKLFNMRGGNFTMPCKNTAAELADKLSPAAEIVGACNTFVNEAVVLGAGGAGTAIQVQLALEGAKEVAIFNMKDDFFDKAVMTMNKLEEKCPEVKVSVEDIMDQAKLKEAIENCDIVINSTIIGMKPHDDKSLVDKSLFRKDLVVADTVYNPEKTKLILEAEEAGCKTITGKGMLLQQGAVNYELFTGKKMPVAELLEFQKKNQA